MTAPVRVRIGRLRGGRTVIGGSTRPREPARPALAATALPPPPPGWGENRVDPPGVSYLLGDPAGEWRRPGRYLDAVFGAGFDAPDGPEVLRGHDAAALLDLWFASVEWLQMNVDPEVRAFARRMECAGEAMLRGDKGDDGRAVPLGRMLGLQPASGATASPSIRLARRKTLLRKARASDPAWAAATDRQAATMIHAALNRYRTTAWPRDRERETAPAVEPAASFWRLLRLDPNRPAPGTTAGLARVLATEV